MRGPTEQGPQNRGQQNQGNHSYAVRAANRADVAGVDALLARAYPRLLKKDYAPSVMILALPLIARAQPGLVACGTYFVVEDADGAIIGAGGWTRGRPEVPTGGTVAGLGNIRHVVTDDRQVRRGVGRALMTHVFRTTRDAEIDRLDCMSTLTAVPFYQALGFGVVGPITVPLGPGIDFPAVAMRRQL